MALLTWQTDTFGYAESFDEAAGRYRGLRGGQHVTLAPESSALLVKPDVARKQIDADCAAAGSTPASQPASAGMATGGAVGVAPVRRPRRCFRRGITALCASIRPG